MDETAEPKKPRSRAREVAFQVLYREDLNPEVAQEWIDAFLEEKLHHAELCRFASDLVAGVREHRREIDAAITSVAENWTLQRMAATDRNAMRLGAYEILFGVTPNKVAITEAVAVARQYGSENSTAFVNGILDRVMRDHEPTEGDPPPLDSPSDQSRQEDDGTI